jgi:uncharacterized membrane protein
MGIMIAMVGLQTAFDRWNRADHAILERLGKSAAENFAASGNRRTLKGILITLGVAVTGSGTAYLTARHLTQIINTVNIYTWTIIIVSLIGVMLSLTPARNLERLGATRTGYDLLYFVLTSIGAKASVTGIGSAFILIAAGMLIVIIHAIILLIGARLIRAPMFLVAAASLANIGGVASAPVVAEVYQPGLASIGLLLAILGNIVGTWLGIACAHLCRMM